MEIVMTTWDVADLEALSAVARASNPLLREHAVEDIKNYLSNINQRFPSDFVMEAREGHELLGWLSFQKTSSTMGEMGRWQPHVVGLPARETAFRKLLTTLANLAASQEILRIEVGYGQVSEDNLENYMERAQWLEKQDFQKLEDNLFMACALSQFDLCSSPIPDAIEIHPISNIGPDNLFACYKESFSISEHRQFFDYSEQQVREAYDDLFDLSKPFNAQASLVLVEAGRAIGFSLVRPRVDEEHLAMFGLHPEYRGSGLAMALLLKSIGILRGQGVQRLTLGVDAVNQPAVKLYEKAGFERESRMIVHSWNKAE